MSKRDRKEKARIRKGNETARKDVEKFAKIIMSEKKFTNAKRCSA